MVSYDFYIATYRGDSLGENDFHRLSRRAEAMLSRYKRIYTVSGTPESEHMAICAMADALAYYEAAANGSLTTSVSVGSVSSSASAPAVDMSLKAQERELYRCASEYLEIYRGCV